MSSAPEKTSVFNNAAWLFLFLPQQSETTQELSDSYGMAASLSFLSVSLSKWFGYFVGMNNESFLSGRH